MQKTGEPNQSGKLWIEADVIHYNSTHYGCWSCPLSDILLIGEYTNTNGPFLDDWFFVFMVAGPKWFEASMYASGVDTFRDDLKRRIGSESCIGLANSTDFKSRVIWPAQLADQPLFDFHKVEGTTLARRIKLAIYPEIQFCLTADVDQYLLDR